MTLNMVVHISLYASRLSEKLSPERNDGIGILEVFCGKWLSKHEYWKRDVSSVRNILFQIIDKVRHCKSIFKLKGNKFSISLFRRQLLPEYEVRSPYFDSTFVPNVLNDLFTPQAYLSFSV